MYNMILSIASLSEPLFDGKLEEPCIFAYSTLNLLVVLVSYLCSTLLKLAFYHSSKFSLIGYKVTGTYREELSTSINDH